MPVMTDETTIDVRKLYKAASEVEGLTHFSFVGPFGQRVSFASQQRRAINTVWAAYPELPTDRAPVVAVVGAGIAGLTTAAALLVKGCRVTLIEREVLFAKPQRSASHRYVHPTINFWPEKTLDSTTDFPFLEWHEDICGKVADAIVEEWDRTFSGALTGCLMETTVTAIETSGEKAVVHFDRAVGGNMRETGGASFDHVFITTGFGVENKLHDTDPTYWEPDSFEHRRKIKGSAFVIGGTGDGGLIEALRLIQRGFDNGRLCLEIVRMMDDANLASEVQRIEERVKRESGDANTAALAYWDAYGSLADQLTGKISEKLSSRHDNASVTLVGRLPQPFQTNSAPIHKLMIAHALRSEALEYVQGELLTNAGGGTDLLKGKDTSSLPNKTNVVVRIGPKHPLNGLIKPADVEKLKERQGHMADLLSPAPIDLSFFTKATLAPRKGSNEHAMSRQRLASTFMAKQFSGAVKVLHRDGGPVFSMTERCDGPIPERLFGIPLQAGTMLEASPL